MGHVGPVDKRVHHLPQSQAERQLAARLRANKGRMANLQCVALAKLAVEDFRSVQCWRRGEPVLSKRFPLGTPIATFLDRDGGDSLLYDGGVGVGAPGNMTTHAAVLIDYIEGADGAVDGILVLDQHALLDGFRRMIYPVDASAYGTATATNYFTIHDETGTPLGATQDVNSASASFPKGQTSTDAIKKVTWDASASGR
ncbi:MAG: hypothetical protein AAFY35_15450 [Pseudomonadota bacterium]